MDTPLAVCDSHVCTSTPRLLIGQAETLEIKSVETNKGGSWNQSWYNCLSSKSKRTYSGHSHQRAVSDSFNLGLTLWAMWMTPSPGTSEHRETGCWAWQSGVLCFCLLLWTYGELLGIDLVCSSAASPTRPDFTALLCSQAPHPRPQGSPHFNCRNELLSCMSVQPHFKCFLWN